MPIATFRGEKNIGEIADKLYTRLTPRQREIAEKAIRNANPQLDDIKNVREGSILRVPDIPELRPKTNRSLDNPDAQIVKEISDALRDYQEDLTTHTEQAVSATKEQLALLKNARFKKALRDSPIHQEVAGQAGKHLSARQKTLGVQQKALDEVIRELTKDLSEGFG